METDRIIASIASRQHSVVTRPQLLETGISRSAIDRRVAGGRLVPMHAGVYRPDGHPRSWQRSLMAAVLAGGGGVVSHRGAAHLLGVPGVEPRAEITVAMSRAPTILTVVVHRGTLEPADVTTLDGIPTTRPVRTLIDLAAVVTPAHSSRTDWGRDHDRNRWLTAIGWRLLPITWDDLAEPTYMINAVRRGLQEKPRYAG